MRFNHLVDASKVQIHCLEIGTSFLVTDHKPLQMNHFAWQDGPYIQ